MKPFQTVKQKPDVAPRRESLVYFFTHHDGLLKIRLHPWIKELLIVKIFPFKDNIKSPILSPES
jgi:hypothetical protein